MPTTEAGPRRGVTALRVLVLVVGIAVTALTLARQFVGSRPPGMLVDYEVYRWAVATWFSGASPYQGGVVLDGFGVLPWVYPPVALLPLSVVAVVPYWVGVVLLSTVTAAALATTAHLVIRRVWPGVGEATAGTVALGLLPVALLLEPVAHNYLIGQINAVLMALVVLDCLVRQPRWPRGLLVGIAAAIKITPLVFLLFFLLRRDGRAAVTAGVTVGAGTGLGFIVDFDASVDYWFGAGPAAAVWGSAFPGNQSILGELARLHLPPVVTTALWVGLVLGSAAALLRGLTRRPDDAPLAVVAIALFALLASPTSWTMHWVWVVPGLLVVAGRAVDDRRWWWLIALMAGTATVLGGRLSRLPIGEWQPWQHVVGSSYTIVGMVLLGLLGCSRAGAGRPRDAPEVREGAAPGNRRAVPMVE